MKNIAYIIKPIEEVLPCNHLKMGKSTVTNLHPLGAEAILGFCFQCEESLIIHNVTKKLLWQRYTVETIEL